MKILFITSSLAAGRDGVGDYARRLAGELVKQGHACALIGLNERHLLAGANRETEQDGLPVLRLAATLPWSHRTEATGRFVAMHSPDWVSLQFVPYGFHPKGFCFGLGRALPQITASSRRHVFFHELCIGLAEGEGLNHRVQGCIQQLAIRRLLKEWKPHRVHTHVPVYQDLLAKWGSRAELLPLFGNIPLAPAGPVSAEFDAWCERRRGQPGRYLLGGYFGSFYPNAAGPEFVAGLRKLAESSNAVIVCFLAGKQTDDTMQRWRLLEASDDARLRWVFLGEMPSEAVSRYLQALDFGIAATPWQLVGKSGSAAAMIDHGLPVLVPREDFKSPLSAADEAVGCRLFVRTSWDKSWTSGAWLPLKAEPAHRVAAVSARYASDLACAAGGSSWTSTR